jgi:hypothetical protein
MVLASTPTDLTKLNEFGGNGWEIVAVSERTIYLKRELIN